MDSWYLEHLVCPVDQTPLTLRGNTLVSKNGHQYPVVDGVPVMLVEDANQTIGIASNSLAQAKSDTAGDLYLDTLGIQDHEKEGIVELTQKGTAIDPVVAYLVGATSGYAYKHLIGTLSEYPIPNLRLPPSDGDRLLDVGCNWGRWSIAAARKGYSVAGIDPSLGAVMAARRVAQDLGLPIKFVVGDARFLPFRSASFDAVFSYSVLQHLSRSDVNTALAEAGRVLASGGTSLIQMAHWLGVRSLYHQMRRRFRAARDFEVRYWSIPELKRTFQAHIGPSSVSVDCYFGLGLQASDAHLLSPLPRAATTISEGIRALSKKMEALKYVADSVYVKSTRAPH